MYQNNKNRLRRLITGIEKTETILRVLSLSHHDEGYQVEWCFESPPSNPDLSTLVQSHSGYFKNVVLGLSEVDVISKTFSLPENTPDDQITPQLEVMFENYIPYPQEDMYWDYCKNGEEVLVAAVKKERIKNQIAYFDALHIPIHIIDYDLFALERFLHQKSHIANHFIDQKDERYNLAMGLALHPFNNAVRNYDIQGY